MKRLFLVVAIFFIVALSVFSCATQKPAAPSPNVYREEFDKKRQEHKDWLSGQWQSKEQKEQDEGRAMELKLRGVDTEKVAKLDEIKKSVTGRGYLTIDELQEVIDMPYWDKLGDFLAAIVEKDLLPFKALFYLSIERENYDDAELIRRAWSVSLSNILRSLTDEKIKSKVSLQIEKLNIVGLTDPLLVKLRKELVTAINNRKWDDAQKIQSVITSRAEELRPKEPLVIERQIQTQSPASPQVIVVGAEKQADKQRIEVENIPRYGISNYRQFL